MACIWCSCGWVRTCMWLRVCHSSVIVCLSLCVLRHFSSESIYCLSAHNRLSVPLPYFPPLVYLSHSQCLFFVRVHLSALLFLCLCVSVAVLSVWNPLSTPVREAVVGMTPHCLCYRILTGRILSDSSLCLSACLAVCVPIWHSQRSSPDFSRLFVQSGISFQLVCVFLRLWATIFVCVCLCVMRLCAGRKCVYCLFPIDWVESVFVCVCVLLQLEIYLLPSCFHCWPGRPHRCEYCHVNLDPSSFSSSSRLLYVHILIRHLPCHCNLAVSMEVGLFRCDNLTSRPVRGAALTHCHAESVDINTPVELCCLIHVASLLPETLAVRPAGDVARLSCAGTSRGWLCTLSTPGYLQVLKSLKKHWIHFSQKKALEGLKSLEFCLQRSLSCWTFCCMWFLAIGIGATAHKNLNSLIFCHFQVPAMLID